MSDEKTYVMVNKKTGARIECSEKYMLKWLAKGFDVEEIRLPDASSSES